MTFSNFIPFCRTLCTQPRTLTQRPPNSSGRRALALSAPAGIRKRTLPASTRPAARPRASSSLKSLCGRGSTSMKAVRISCGSQLPAGTRSGSSMEGCRKTRLLRLLLALVLRHRFLPGAVPDLTDEAPVRLKERVLREMFPLESLPGVRQGRTTVHRGRLLRNLVSVHRRIAPEPPQEASPGLEVFPSLRGFCGRLPSSILPPVRPSAGATASRDDERIQDIPCWTERSGHSAVENLYQPTKAMRYGSKTDDFGR